MQRGHEHAWSKALSQSCVGCDAVHGNHDMPKTKYAKCGRKRKLTPEQGEAVEVAVEVHFLLVFITKRMSSADV